MVGVETGKVIRDSHFDEFNMVMSNNVCQVILVNQNRSIVDSELK
jgi:hypothetical protein